MPFKDLKEGKDVSDSCECFDFKENDLRPIAYESRKMTPTEQRYSAQECELLAIVHALKKWRGYIKGSPILIRTDHESLKHFHTQKHLGRRLARFNDDIAHFDVKIIYHPWELILPSPKVSPNIQLPSLAFFVVSSRFLENLEPF